MAHKDKTVHKTERMEAKYKIAICTNRANAVIRYRLSAHGRRSVRPGRKVQVAVPLAAGVEGRVAGRTGRVAA